MPEGTQIPRGGVRFPSSAGWLHAAAPPACTHPSRTRTNTCTRMHNSPAASSQQPRSPGIFPSPGPNTELGTYSTCTFSNKHLVSN